MTVDAWKESLQQCIAERLQPHVRKIDADAFYPADYMTGIGTAGLLQSAGISETERRWRNVCLVEETAKVCMTTAFNVWCHLAALTYVHAADNPYLRGTILPALEQGQLLGGTGLSNPMKYYAGMEKLHLQATHHNGAYTLSGQLPMVSNLGPTHWFAIVASVEDRRRVMAFLPCTAERLSMKEKVGYLGLNGSATYACKFDDLPIKDEWIISEDADAFVCSIRSTFLLYQIPLGLGVTASAIQSIAQVSNKQEGCNRYLQVQANELEEEWLHLRERTRELCGADDLCEKWHDTLELRLAVTELTMKAVHANMLHHGSAGYIQQSGPSRRLRESYFLANLTPTVKHLEKLTRSS